MHAVSSTTDPAVEVVRNLGIIIGFTVAALVLGSLTLRRRTP